jgi:hypothetical protein
MTLRYGLMNLIIDYYLYAVSNKRHTLNLNNTNLLISK